MSSWIGIHIDLRYIRATQSRGERMLAQASVERRQDEELAERLTELFEQLPLPARRCGVAVALHDRLATSKQLPGLPAEVADEDLDSLVREGAARFFLGDPSAGRFAVRRLGEAVTADRYDGAAVAACVKACASAGVGRCLVTSAIAIDIGTNELADPSFAVAHAVTVQSRRRGPVLVAIGDASDAVPVWRTRLATAAVVVTALALVGAPIVRNRLSAAIALRQLEQVRTAANEAEKARADIRALDTRLRRIRELRLSRPASGLLASIARALPRGSALVTVTVDSMRGSAVVVSSDALAALPALEAVRELESVKLAGPVSRERLGDHDLDRATIAFVQKVP